MFFISWFFLQVRLLRNCLRKSGGWFFFRDLWHLLIVAAALALFYLLIRSLFSFLGKQGLSVFDFAFALLSFSLLTFLPLVFYNAMVGGLSFFFQKTEIQFYRSLPLGWSAVFAVKFFQTYLQSVWMAFLGFITILAAVRDHLGFSPAVYLTGGAGFLAMTLIPVSLAVIAVLVLSRFFEFTRARNFLMLAGLLTGSVLVAFIRLMQPEQLVSPEGKLRLVSFIQELPRPWAPVFPSEWLAGLIYAQSRHDNAGVCWNLVNLFVSAGLVLGLAFLAARILYPRAWSRAVFSKVETGKGFGWNSLLKLFPRSSLKFVEKDLLNLYRDTVERGSLLVLIPLGFVYFYSQFLLYRYVRNVGGEQFFSFIYLYLFNFFYSSVIIAGLSGRWVFPSISIEGHNFKLIRGSPLPLGDFIKAKFLTGLIPLFLLGEFLILGSSYIMHFSAAYTLLACLIMGFLSCGMITIALGNGMRYADFSVSDPLEAALSRRGFLCLAAEMVFAFAVMLMVSIPVSFFYNHGVCRQTFIYCAVSFSLLVLTALFLAGFYSRSSRILSRKEI